MANISYAGEADNLFEAMRKRLSNLPDGVRICDVRGGAHPFLSLEEIRERRFD